MCESDLRKLYLMCFSRRYLPSTIQGMESVISNVFGHLNCTVCWLMGSALMISISLFLHKTIKLQKMSMWKYHTIDAAEPLDLSLKLADQESLCLKVIFHLRHGIFTAVELGHGQRFCYEKEILRKDTNLPFLLPMLHQWWFCWRPLQSAQVHQPHLKRWPES